MAVSHPSTAGADGTQKERVPVLIFDEPAQLSFQVARRIATLIEERNAVGDSLVLGLPTGSTPIGVYGHLVRMHREEGLDFSRVVTFNLDEYYPMQPDSLQSYHRFMRENFFDHVNIPEESIHIPKGDVGREELEEYCQSYEFAIQKAGGIDLILLGIGRSGHVGFNEPGSGVKTRTRPIVLDEITRKDAASDFFGDDNVPREAITMGVGTILDAREVILIATGEHKAPIVRRAVEEEPSREVTATFLQHHRDCTFYLDRAAASELTREKTPWLVKSVTWTDHMAKRAVIWLSEVVGRAILRLEESDFHRQHLHDLVSNWPDTDSLCRKVFEDLRQRVRYLEQLPAGERIIVFSPHPDDDVISMGGMLDKLARNENDLTVAYMTNGSVAVFDADVRRYLHFLELSLPVMGDETLQARVEAIRDALAAKGPGEIDTAEVQRIKAYIRYAEAVSAIEVMRLGKEHARFLDMPFYQTGMVRKNPIGPQDVEIVLGLMNELKPAHIFVAGDLSDPHGTHRMCYAAIAAAVDAYRGQHGFGPLVWLYRGAWQEWEIDRAEVFVPLTKSELNRKIEAIFKHESQKDRAMFPGAYDAREFWERARDRNTRTAEALNNLGLPEFYAAEAYVTAERLI
ncbi:MAG: glucosamine-6-phosphate deaminase [Rhodothermales bacterium]|nr:glucosamine-6-phosphate deaminase [Rhodothermales bacterium]MBO6781428.1 glucosamine-6-phosphate deaminase [Rhodothermales bacterium]